MTDLRAKLDELQKLCDGATPGPWSVVSDCNRFAVYSSIADMDVVTSKCREYLASQLGHLGSTKVDATFIAASRAYMPLLIEVARAAKDLAIESREDLGHDKMNLTRLVQAIVALESAK